MAKEESKYGFKDRAKAEESLELLKSEDHKYQLLTVRGLIGRAKRVLTLTKAEEKVNNIKEAIETLQNWLDANSSSAASTKNAKPKDAEEKVETVPGLSFKDKQAAEQTLKILDGRDPDYQKLALKGLLGSAKRVLPATKNEDKLKSIKEAVALFEDFLDVFDREERGKQNMPYLPIELIRQLPAPAASDELAVEFLQCYETVAKGNYKRLRTQAPNAAEEDAERQQTWDIVRNSKLHALKAKSCEKLFHSDGKPTDAHLKMVQWAFSPQVEKLRAFAATAAKSSSSSRKRSHASSEEEPSSKAKESKSDHDRSSKRVKK